MFHGHFDSDWASLIDMVAQSIAEAEYVAITITTNQAFLAWKITY